MKHMTMPDFEKKLATEKLAIIDVRPAERYETGHIPGAVNIPLDQLENKLAELDSDQAYYIVCQMGIKSQEATKWLTQAGFDATNVEGGTSAFAGELSFNSF